MKKKLQSEAATVFKLLHPNKSNDKDEEVGEEPQEIESDFRVWKRLQTSLNRAGADLNLTYSILNDARSRKIGMYLPWNMHAAFFRVNSDVSVYKHLHFVDALYIEEPSMVSNTRQYNILSILPNLTQFVAGGDPTQLHSINEGTPFADLCEFAKTAQEVRESVGYQKFTRVFRCNKNKPELIHNRDKLLTERCIWDIKYGSTFADLDQSWVHLHAPTNGYATVAKAFVTIKKLNQWSVYTSLEKILVITQFQEHACQINEAIRRLLFQSKYDFNDRRNAAMCFIRGEKLRVERSVRTKDKGTIYTGTLLTVKKIFRASSFEDDKGRTTPINNLQDYKAALLDPSAKIRFKLVDDVSVTTWDLSVIESTCGVTLNLNEIDRHCLSLGYCLTVHSIQGDQADVCIFYFARPSHFDEGALIQTEFLNVALSRCKEQQVLVGDLHYLEESLQKSRRPQIYTHLVHRMNKLLQG